MGCLLPPHCQHRRGDAVSFVNIAGKVGPISAVIDVEKYYWFILFHAQPVQIMRSHYRSKTGTLPPSWTRPLRSFDFG